MQITQETLSIEKSMESYFADFQEKANEWNEKSKDIKDNL